MARNRLQSKPGGKSVRMRITPEMIFHQRFPRLPAAARSVATQAFRPDLSPDPLRNRGPRLTPATPDTHFRCFSAARLPPQEAVFRAQPLFFSLLRRPVLVFVIFLPVLPRFFLFVGSSTSKCKSPMAHAGSPSFRNLDHQPNARLRSSPMRSPRTRRASGLAPPCGHRRATPSPGQAEERRGASRGWPPATDRTETATAPTLVAVDHATATPAGSDAYG